MQSKESPVKVEATKGRSTRKAKSQSTIKQLVEQSPSTDLDLEGSKSVSNPLRDRIRATLKEQKSPVKQESVASTSSASKVCVCLHSLGVFF